jgi:hypothetical protein
VVSLIKHTDTDIVQTDCGGSEMVEEATWAGNDDVDTGSQSA